MSISIFIRAIKPADEKHKKMLEIYRLCKQSNISCPQEVLNYFGDTEPNELGVVIDHYDLPIECRQEFSRDEECGFKIDTSYLPSDVRYLEVFLS